MTQSSRRDFLKLLAAGGIVSSAALSSRKSFAKKPPHIVVIGGGTGGATAAKYLKIGDANLRVTIIEASPVYRRCYGSSEVLTGQTPYEDISISYDHLRDKYGVEFVFDTVSQVNARRRRILLKSGEHISYDRLIVSPGIDFEWRGTSGYDKKTAQGAMPHAWKAGEQTLLLKKQIDAMPTNGTMIIVPPPSPYRCPPGPYERASLLAEMFRKKKSCAKIIILDQKDGFAMDQAFMLGWNRLYGYQLPVSKSAGMPDDVKTYETPGMIEWVAGADGGKVVSVDPHRMKVKTAAGDTIRADVINFIPPQKAAKLAFRMGLTKGNWCPVNPVTMESTLHANIHVIGDSVIADAMPKSGFAANTQAKVAAIQILRLLRGEELLEPVWSNICFSRVNAQYGVSIAEVFRLDHETKKIVLTPNSGGTSPLNASRQFKRMEALYQEAWVENFVADSFG